MQATPFACNRCGLLSKRQLLHAVSRLSSVEKVLILLAPVYGSTIVLH